jgi:hypothetical protein
MPSRHHLDKRADELAISVASNGQPDDLLRSGTAAKELGVSEQFLTIGRSRGYGPPFLRLSKSVVRYRRSDLVEWLNQRLYHCTSEYADRPKSGRPRKAASPRRRKAKLADAAAD